MTGMNLRQRMHLYAHTDDTYTPVGIRPHTSLHRHVFTLDWLHGANKEKKTPYFLKAVIIMK